jgi:hypothetical protein
MPTLDQVGARTPRRSGSRMIHQDPATTRHLVRRLEVRPGNGGKLGFAFKGNGIHVFEVINKDSDGVTKHVS